VVWHKLFRIYIHCIQNEKVAWIRGYYRVFSSRKHEFDTRSVHVGSVMNNVAPG